MTAANVPMEIDQGEDWSTTIVYTDDFDEPYNVIARDYHHTGDGKMAFRRVHRRRDERGLARQPQPGRFQTHDSEEEEEPVVLDEMRHASVQRT